jgi:phosphatidylglycerol:prolipoprotein diacylglycerol transferase
MLGFVAMNIQFHWYGFFVGLAAVVGWWLVDAKLALISAYKKPRYQALFWVLVGVEVVIGARLWHVFTDWHLYQSNPESIIYIWNGGLSIVGAVLGGLLGVIEWWLVNKREVSLGTVLDAFVFGLPVAQAIGRIGNFVNQELYGWPTTLPWAIPIDAEHRLNTVRLADRFHPLFLYEALAVLLFWLWVKWWQENTSVKKDGVVFAAYITYYAAIRYALDFLRPERGMLHQVGWVELGSNQLVMVVWVIGGVSALWYLWHKQAEQAQILRVLTGAVIAWIVAVTMWGSPYATAQQYQWVDPAYTSSRVGSALGSTEMLDIKYDHQEVMLDIFRPDLVSDSAPVAELQVEVVNTPASMTQGLSDRNEIGSDGMLFIFPNPGPLRFWMRRMHFDLDMVWIRKGKIIGITSNVSAPQPLTPESLLPSYASPSDADMVLELPAGTAEKLGLEKDMELQYRHL